MSPNTTRVIEEKLKEEGHAYIFFLLWRTSGSTWDISWGQFSKATRVELRIKKGAATDKIVLQAAPLSIGIRGRNMLGNHSFPYINWVWHSAKGMDVMVFVKCDKKSILNQYVDGRL